MIVSAIDDCKRIGGKVVAQEVDGRFWKTVFLFAGAVTGAATDAKRAVEQQRFLRYCIGVHLFTWRDFSAC
jgi:hypothetical protein